MAKKGIGVHGTDTERKKGSANPAKASKCPVSKETFLKDALPIKVTIGDQVIYLTPREFASGSFGWYASEKPTMLIGTVPVKTMGNLTLIVIGSKPGENATEDVPS